MSTGQGMTQDGKIVPLIVTQQAHQEGSGTTYTAYIAGTTCPVAKSEVSIKDAIKKAQVVTLKVTHANLRLCISMGAFLRAMAETPLDDHKCTLLVFQSLDVIGLCFNSYTENVSLVSFVEIKGNSLQHFGVFTVPSLEEVPANLLNAQSQILSDLKDYLDYFLKNEGGY